MKGTTATRPEGPTTTKAHASSQSQQQKRGGEWYRQSVVKRSLSYVEDDIQHVLAQSPFLQQSEPGQHIALFHRSEIITGTRLGKGGFSYVYEIIDFALNPHYSDLLSAPQQQLREYYREQTRTGHGRYAIKHLQEKLLNDPRSYQCAASDLAVEAAYMSALDHPNVLSVRGLPIHGLDSLSEGRHDSYFIILDRLEETLDRRISNWRKQDMPVLGKAGYALQLAGALQYLHERGILFRDLKPHNVGFQADGRLQLLDFGLCREIPRSTDGKSDAIFEMSGVGTRRYMAVEIVNSNCYNDKADVYSWSMVFWEMLSLSKPYPAYSVEDHQRFVCQGGERPPLAPEWPLALQNLLKHSWATSIPERLSMKEVECLLRTYIECCKMLDDAPESPTAVDDQSLLWMDNQGQEAAVEDVELFYHKDMADDGTVTTAGTSLASALKQQSSLAGQEEANAEAFMLRDHRMSFSLRDMSASNATTDLFSSQGSSVFDDWGTSAVGTAASTAASTVISSFDLDSLGGSQGFGRVSSI
eukprot:CAMPEP_0172444244 /NCGR_PEP_ID=MMETSP1065-20121228/4306_1 /TAXON_ID=265537 /ORGANISM="Amphiprora paludosa, Strain CCMP125" /LENGTH=528 /DNA_ID=CAMNT_0013194701 /DNA_START=33 /DNA_END=1619 /DNA_ORIENTATION=+